MCVTYPSPEPVVTPRAREGLRAVVPTIFPPSAVNRGESVRVRPPEPPREHHRLPSPPPALLRAAEDRFQPTPKKRGPKPKLRFKDGLLCGGGGGGGGPSRELAKSRSQEPLVYSASNLVKHGLADGLERGSDMRVIKLAHRPLHGPPCYTPKTQMRLAPAGGSKPHHHHPHHHHKHHHAAGLSLHSHSHSHPQRPGLDAHGYRTKGCLLHHSPLHLKHLAHSSLCQKKEDAPPPAATLCQPGLLAKVPAVPPQVSGPPEEELCWKPCLGNLEKVVVTDVTTNFLTVTIKESSTDKGFFKGKR